MGDCKDELYKYKIENQKLRDAVIKMKREIGAEVKKQMAKQNAANQRAAKSPILSFDKRRKALWVPSVEDKYTKDFILAMNEDDMLISSNSAQSGMMFSGVPVLMPEMLGKLYQYPFVFIHGSIYKEARETLKSYGYREYIEFDKLN